ALERGEGAMTRVWLRLPRRVIHTRAPRRLAHVRIRHVVANVRQLLRGGALRPHALRSAEVWNAGVGGYARAGEPDDPPRLVDPPSDFFDCGDVVGHSFQLS